MKQLPFVVVEMNQMGGVSVRGAGGTDMHRRLWWVKVHLKVNSLS